MEKKFAIPTINGELTQHFGQCDKFAIVETVNNKIISQEFISPPVHRPGVYPRFLAKQGVKVIIAGGMGQRAQNQFAQNNIEVYIGLNAEIPKILVEGYLNNQLQNGQNQCDH